MNGPLDGTGVNWSERLSSGIPTLSLFSGAGGLDIGFQQAGYDIRACVEIEPSYAATLRANLGNHDGFSNSSKVYCQDIRTFDPTPYQNVGIRCVIGGPPCQTFSAAGRRSGGVIGLDDQRGQLFRAYCRILECIRPEVFVFENVYGLPGANGGAPWKEINEAFAAAGYELKAEVVDAADYGVPQHRERLIMVGFRARDFAFPIPTHGPDSLGGLPLVSVKDAIQDLQDPAESLGNGLGGLYGHLLPEVPEGLNYAYFTAEMGHPNPVFAWRSKFHDLLYKVKRDEPCRTIKAQPGKFTGPFHWKNRHFSAAELKRLQTFPDQYEIVGSYGKIVEQIGNSVPPKLAYAIALAVKEQLLDKPAALTMPVRPEGFVSTFRKRQRERSVRFKEIARVANFGQAPIARSPSARSQHEERYGLNPVTLFDRRKMNEGRKADGSFPAYNVTIDEDGSHIDIRMTKDGYQSETQVSTISVTGLKKYLPDFDTCTVLALVDNLEDVFHCWNVVEDALISRSRFFTLIDIYGHYANKGDAVAVTADWRLAIHRNICCVLNRFASTRECGEFESKVTVQTQLGLDDDQLAEAVATLREYRFDLRTGQTHPIIGSDRLICTYPFPLLSPRALVESRVKLIHPANEKISSNAGEARVYG